MKIKINGKRKMTVIFSKKCELALQAILFLSTGEKDKCFSAIDISQAIDIPKEFTSKILQNLTSSGLITSRKGKNGGFCLAKQPKEIRLIDVVEAVDGLDVFHNCVLGFPGCNMDSPCPLHSKWGALREETLKMLSEQNLEEMRENTLDKIKYMKESREKVHSSKFKVVGVC